MARLAERYYIHINELHRFMRFPSVRAVVRTLLIELERSEAQPGPQLDEDGIIDSVDEMISNTSWPERKALLKQPTTPGADFADRALGSCLVKLYANFERWNCWDLRACDRRSVVKVLVAVVGLFCNALTPEIWFEWSLLCDPWIGRTNAAQVLHSDADEDTNDIIPVLVAEVSQPEPEREGRIVVKYDKNPDEERWAFRAILDSGWVGKTPRTGLQCLVDWEYAKPTWQPPRHLSGCDRWVIEFHRPNHGKPGSGSRLKSFL
ncbi:hypothetical protein ColLi_05859 [Colletotrichum liriopes]|uniref:Uncharacterized protein n=1 Tax=Colletotrichum liriopes TaxID=708192 RepID=A0AA37LSV7_9PEZI|nr:hypothetical protein ColLi_05859 [Colletotrichum liriopes]